MYLHNSRSFPIVATVIVTTTTIISSDFRDLNSTHGFALLIPARRHVEARDTFDGVAVLCLYSPTLVRPIHTRDKGYTTRTISRHVLWYLRLLQRLQRMFGYKDWLQYWWVIQQDVKI